MARVAILYGTTEGQTERIAERIAEVLDAEGHRPALFHLDRLPDGFVLEDHDAAVVGASIHVGRHQRYVTRFVRDNAEWLNERPSAFYSVSLTAAEDEEEDREPAQELLDRFLAETGWEPVIATTVAGALRYSKYGLFKRFVMKRIARTAGGGTDTTRDYEYTDWEAVEAFAREFAEHLG